ncbi:Phosphotransferase [Cercospora zeina]
MSFDTLAFSRTTPSTAPRGASSSGLDSHLRQIEEAFLIDASKLKQIVARFEEELDEGLQRDGQNIPMNVTWVMGWPSGQEKGSYLTLDLGGTNLRVCWIELHGREHDIDVTQDQYQIADDIKTGDAEQLWSYVAEMSLKINTRLRTTSRLATLSNCGHDKPIPFGFTFSYPASQQYVDHGILQTWTKGLDISGVEGEDVAAQLKEAIGKRKLPIWLVALINDTTGAMIALSYHDSETKIGAIFGTGCNAAYMEDVGSISKLKGTELPADSGMAINCEYGAFDNSHRVLPRNKYDIEIDEASPRPGEQTFEKLSAGHYMGEMFRLAILDLYEQGLVFKDQDGGQIKKPYVLDTSFLSLIEDDDSINQAETRQAFQEQLHIKIAIAMFDGQKSCE